MAQKWHPDNYQDEDEKKKAEKKFMDIAAAKEVLTDEEMRQKFDHGEDPLDPESERGRGFNPFQHFHQQGGLNRQYKDWASPCATSGGDSGVANTPSATCARNVSQGVARAASVFCICHYCQLLSMDENNFLA